MSFGELVDELSTMIKAKRDAKEIKALNIGSANSREYHWRFRCPDGSIVNLSLQLEVPSWEA